MPAISRPDEAPSVSTLPIRKHRFPTPRLRLHLNDLGHEGSSIFSSNIKGNEDIDTQVQNVLSLLYHIPDAIRPDTRSVTFVLRPFEGVAYTTGTDLDSDHKEIHFNLNYVSGIKSSPPRHEILGVICHELVHCFQWNAEGTCPGGLIEGIADWVRLRAGLAAKHWVKEAEGKWDRGYQHTGFFLEYLENRFGDGTVRKINSLLRVGRYDEKRVFGESCQGEGVEQLWQDYSKQLESEQAAKKSKSYTINDEEPPASPVPSCPPQNS